MKSRAIVPRTVASLAFLFIGAHAAHAQTPAQTPAQGAWQRPNLRLFQQFIPDAAIVDKQWYSAELRFLRGAVPPIEDAEGLLLTPVIAISPLANLEVGGKASYIDYDLDSDELINNGRDRFSGESGLGDLSVWGKYRFVTGDFQVAAGMIIDLPTGSEDDGLGTGKVVPSIFGAFRTRAGDGLLVGEAGVRFNRDATIIDTGLEGENSTFLGGGYIWEPVRNLAISGEVTVESERFRDASSDFRATAGAQWLAFPHSALRGAVGIGLADGAPDFELIVGYAYSF